MSEKGRGGVAGREAGTRLSLVLAENVLAPTYVGILAPTVKITNIAAIIVIINNKYRYHYGIPNISQRLYLIVILVMITFFLKFLKPNSRAKSEN